MHQISDWLNMYIHAEIKEFIAKTKITSFLYEGIHFKSTKKRIFSLKLVDY